MRSRIALWLVPVSVLALLAFLAPVTAGKELTLQRTLAMAPIAILGLTTVLSWRRLWRVGRDDWEIAVYDYGVRGFGATSWACSLGLVSSLAYVLLPAENDLWTTIALRGIFSAAITASVAGTACLWAGFGWGVAMAAVRGAHASAPRGTLPPTISGA